MKERQMYPHNPNSAESILTEKLKDVSHGWFDNQRSIVLEAMEDYAKHCLEAEHERMAELLKETVAALETAVREIKTVDGLGLDRIVLKMKAAIEKAKGKSQ